MSFHSLLPTSVGQSGLTEEKRLLLAAVQRIRILYFYKNRKYLFYFYVGVALLVLPAPCSLSQDLKRVALCHLHFQCSFNFCTSQLGKADPAALLSGSSFMRVLQCDVANSARNRGKLFSWNPLKGPRKALKMKVHFPCMTKKGEKIAQAGLEEQSVIIVAHI